MNRSAAVLRIQEGLGFRADLNDVIIRRLQEEQRQLERGATLPPFLRTDAEEFIILEGSQYCVIPTDVLRIPTDMGGPILADQQGYGTRMLEWADPNDTKKFPLFGPDSQTGVPRRYAGVYWVGPSGPSIYVDTLVPYDTTLYMICYKKAEPLTADVENAWLLNAPELLIGGAGRRIAADVRNKIAVELFTQMYKEQRQLWFNEAIITEQDETGPMVLGGHA